MKALINGIIRNVGVHFPSVGGALKLLASYRHSLEKPRQTPMGFLFAGNQAMGNGTFEPEETEIIRKLLPACDLFINIGANVGYYCCLALQHGKKTIAFEPIASNLTSLLKNLKANDWADSVEVFPLALNNKPGILEIYGDGTGASLIKGWAGISETDRTLVPASTADLILGDRFAGRKCLVLVDIEGAERFMLEGAEILLGLTPKPVWMIEITVSDHQPSGIGINPNLGKTFDLFWSRGYRSWTATKVSREIFPEEIKRIAETGVDTLGSYNFIFADEAVDILLQG